MDSELTVRSLQPTEADLQRFADCFADNGWPTTVEHLRWQYLQPPARKLLVDLSVAHDDGGAEQVAGIYAVFPVEFRVGTARVLGAQSLDTLTDRNFRGRGLFTSLARSVYARCGTEGLALVYGFPNGSSAPGFFNKLGWLPLDPVPFMIRPLRSGYFARRVPVLRSLPLPDLPLPGPSVPALPAGWRIEPLTRFDERADELWDRFASDVKVAVQRSGAYLNWRMARPGAGYTILALTEGERLLGFVAFGVKEKHGGRIGYVIEQLSDPAAPAAARLLLATAVAAMKKDRADAVLAWSLGHAPNHRAYQATGFVRMPERLRPIELHFGVRPLQPEHAAALADRSGWYLSYCDSDTV